MFDLSFEKLLVIGVLALFLVGPQRLPQIAAQLARWVKVVQAMTRDAKQRLREEVGDDVDWQQLDPRRYDPRRIVREALLDESELRPMPTGTPEEPQEPAAAGHARESDEQELQPVRTATAEEPAAAVRARTFDDEAT